MKGFRKDVGPMLLGHYALALGLVFMLIFSLPMVSEGKGDIQVDIKHPIAERLRINKTGHTEAFGGGNYVGISNKDNDAWIAVIYGTSKRPNSIVVVSHYTRYLGAADVYDASGGLIAKNRPIRVSTIFAQRFDTIYEFNDTNDDGICNAVRRNLPLRPKDVIAHEPVYKAVHLNTSWERSEVIKVSENDTTIRWEFTLTARDLPYTIIGDESLINTSVGDGKLNVLKLTFHLEVVKKTATVSVPIYKVHVNLGDDGREIGVVSSEYLTTRTFTGIGLDANIKYDHYIEGWDFEPKNKNPGLVFETHLLMGMAVSSTTYQWINEQFVGNNIPHAEGKVEYEAAGEGQVELDSSSVGDNNTSNTPRIIRKNRLNFRDNWQSIGALTWVSNVTVYHNESDIDGQEDEMYFMIYGGIRIKQMPGGYRFGKMVFRGIAIMGGWSYPAGYKIVHDPTYTCTMVTPEIEEESASSVETDGGDKEGRFIPGFEVFLLMSAVGIIAGIITVNRKRAR